jgi:2-polyprenyl-3-methyl-5-hydroxy-6-metoxy-1,4-benzoquinol methylase
MTSHTFNVDSDSLTPHSYWQEVWESTELKPVNIRQPYYIDLLAVFSRAKSLLCSSNIEFLEIGCAGSVWLPFLSNRYHWNVTGIDYSNTGCIQARNNLLRNDAKGCIYNRDIFEPNDEMLGKYDIVYSCGLIEHFLNPVRVVKQMTRYMKPEGIIVTVIPNLFNPSTVIQRIVGPRTLSMHKFIALKQLKCIHKAANLSCLFCEHIGLGGIIVPDKNTDKTDTVKSANEYESTINPFTRNVIHGFLRLNIRAIQCLRNALGPVLPRCRLLSPCMVFVGRIQNHKSL